jgi:hypothetical protein
MKKTRSKHFGKFRVDVGARPEEWCDICERRGELYFLIAQAPIEQAARIVDALIKAEAK